uniref:Apolipoprotein A-IV n=1 Tax=Mola mola TaxID=94237 RepID=A0A3Q4BFR4_MOLML
MKVLVVLALAVFSVCNANILWHEPPKSNLDVVKDAFWDYVAKATLTAEESLTQIRQSELGQEVNARIAQSTDTVNQYVAALRTQVAPLTQDLMTRVSQEAEQLKARLEKDLTDVSTNLQPLTDMVVQLQRQVEELKREVAPYTEAMDPETLKAVLLQKSQQLKAELDKNANELQGKMIPLAEDMRERVAQSLDDFQKTLIPLAQSFETQLTQKTQEIQERLVPYGEELRAKLDTGAQDLQAQLTALLESFTKKTQ